MRFAELETRDVAVWGYGREGRVALAALCARFPDKPLTLYCTPEEAAAAREVSGKNSRIVDSPPDAAALSSHEIVIKSPGISAYKPEIAAARERGTRFTSGTALWFAENPDARVIAVTGTKGKSTTTAMIAHCARALGVRTALAGNIGLPLLELDGQRAELWAIELSSFQTGEAGSLELGVIVSLEEEHLDWHGTRERYLADKLKLAELSRTLLVNAQSSLLMQRTSIHSRRATFGDARGWHAAEGAILRGEENVLALDALPTHGAHNAVNVCAALAAIETFGLDARAAASALKNFRPLPHRLQSLGLRNGIEWIDDSIATTPAAALAALQSLQGRAVTLILGGFDRGLDWNAFARAITQSPPHAVIAQGANAARIVEALTRAAVCARIERTDDLNAAGAEARAITPPGGVILLSPGAPSFDQFRDYAQRGRAFARLAGLDATINDAIAGLGIA